MTPQQVADRIRHEAHASGMTVHKYAEWLNSASKEEIARAMEGLPTEALEWAVKFEALSHRGKT